MTSDTSPQAGRSAQALRAALLISAVAVSSHLAVLLFTGGFSFRVLGLEFSGARVAAPAMLLSALVIAVLLLARHITSLEALSARGAAVLALGALIVYLSNGRTLPQGDTIGAAYLPLSIVREGNFDLQEFPFLYSKDNWYWQFLEESKGRWVSKYPVGAAILATPVYLLSALGPVKGDSPFVDQLEKLAAAIIAALSVLVVHLAVRRLATSRAALLITAVYALGTSTFSVSSQALWQHGPSQLAFATALYCLIRAHEDPLWAGFAGLPLAFAVIARPTDVLLATPIGIYVLVYHRRQLRAFTGGAAVPLLFQVWYNITYYGTPLHSQFNPLAPGFFGVPLSEGLAGILLSPSRGLFVYSPVLVFSLVGLVAVWRRGGDPLLRAVAVGMVMGALLYGKYAIWFAGYTYGPRFLSDFLPGLALLLVPVVPAALRWRSTTAVFVILGVWSVTAHAIGVYLDDTQWNTFMDIPGIEQEEINERLWMWRDNQLFNPVADLAIRLGAVVSRTPTSAQSDALRALYRTDLPAKMTTDLSTPISFVVTITNTSPAVWLSRAIEGPGAVDLGWFWVGSEGRRAGSEGRLPLRISVLPGRTQTLRPVIQPPSTPGPYTLEWGLVSEGDHWLLPRNQLDVVVQTKLAAGTP